VSGGVLNAAASLADAEHVDCPTCVDPAPSFVPAEGEERWDALIVQVDRERSVLVLDLIACRGPGEPLHACLSPKRAYARLAAGCKVSLRSDETAVRTLADAREGLYVSVAGKIPQAGAAMEAHAARLGLTMGS
jgi:hypothetical protein